MSFAPETLVPVDDFPDPHDERFFPQLTPALLLLVKHYTEQIELPTGHVLFEHGQRDCPFYIIEEGSVGFFDRRPDGDRYFAKGIANTFIGDTSMFTGQPALAACVALEPLTVLVMSGATLRKIVAEHAELGDIFLRTMMTRRTWLEGHGYGQVQLIGSSSSPETFKLRDFLSRNQLPFRWYDPETDSESSALLSQLHIPPETLPVLICGTGVCRSPTIETIAERTGLRPKLKSEPYDLVVVGMGPAGLAAAVYGASEGIDTLILDGDSPGGQAGTSSKIENYLGFAAGISGSDLARQAVLQARKFGATLSNPRAAISIECSDADGRSSVEKIITLDCGSRVRAKTVLIATGARYRRLDAEGCDRFEGAGVYYAAGYMEAIQCRQTPVVIVGGGNSAGQAAVYLAGHVSQICIVIRGPRIEDSMSSYLIDRLHQLPNVEILCDTRVQSLVGDKRLQGVELLTANGACTRDATAVFAMVGAEPRTEWLSESDCVGLDLQNFIATGHQAEEHELFRRHWKLERRPYFLETTRPGVLAVGDVRAGSVKRVASAVGEGSMAITYVHQLLAIH